MSSYGFIPQLTHALTFRYFATKKSCTILFLFDKVYIFHSLVQQQLLSNQLALLPIILLQQQQKIRSASHRRIGAYPKMVSRHYLPFENRPRASITDQREKKKKNCTCDFLSPLVCRVILFFLHKNISNGVREEDTTEQRCSRVSIFAHLCTVIERERE